MSDPRIDTLDRYAFLSLELGKRYECGVKPDDSDVVQARAEAIALMEEPGSRLIYLVREFLDYTARVQRIDSRVVKNYADEMRKALRSA